jgi:hypothetical protein
VVMKFLSRSVGVIAGFLLLMAAATENCARQPIEVW